MILRLYIRVLCVVAHAIIPSSGRAEAGWSLEFTIHSAQLMTSSKPTSKPKSKTVWVASEQWCLKLTSEFYMHIHTCEHVHLNMHTYVVHLHMHAYTPTKEIFNKEIISLVVL